MKTISQIILGLCAIVFLNINIFAADDSLIALWNFDDVNKKSVLEKISGQNDTITGNNKIVDGVSGKAIMLDGFTSFITRTPEQAPKIDGPFSLEAWIALGAYPTNWCPILDNHKLPDMGYFFGIDAKGHLGFSLSVDSQWQSIVSQQTIPLRQWTHIAALFSPQNGLAIYINGKPTGFKEVTGKFSPAVSLPLLIGRHSIEQKPEGTIRPPATAAVYTYFDGIIDEIKIYSRTLSSADILGLFEKTKPSAKPDIPQRTLPAGPAGTGPFGAFYSKLKYYEQWDSFWPVGDFADVVVRFDTAPCRFVFWRGTNYIPNWVTENGIWYNNEFNETWGHGAIGCAEPMSDKQCRHSHVRIIESSDARVVVHWRYALVDNYYNFARVDELTGWGDWTDEIYTIYPDMAGIRQITLHSNAPAEPHEWQESIIVMGPGQTPDEVIKTEALTLANMEGQTHTYSWEKAPPPNPREPKNANIHLINTNSVYKPFVILLPQSEPSYDIYSGELRRDVSKFPWWNHWPTATKPSDGRYAMASDQASHSSLTHIFWKPYSQTKNSMTKIMLNGLTDTTADQLVPLAKSWSSPAEIKLSSGSFSSSGYDPAQRAYILSCSANGKPKQLKFELKASEQSPVINPAFVIKNWGESNPSLKINGKKFDQGPEFRFGHRRTIEGTDLIVWIKQQTTKPVQIVLSASD